jgi:hypothetical protein
MPDQKTNKTPRQRHEYLRLVYMNNSILNQIDQLLEVYKKNHKGMNPLYIVLSPEEIKQVREHIRNKNNHPADYVITTYKDVKLSEHPSLLPGKMYVSNELPETGS